MRCADLGAEAEFAGVRITVDDEGEGIAPEIRARGSSPSSGSTARAAARASGMYIVNGLVRAHGGTVTIDDAPGGGARIVIAWPAHDLTARVRGA